MNSSASQVRQRLLEDCLNCVKACQARFGGRPELATGEDEGVALFCKQIELILNHGLKDKDTNLGLAVIRNVRDLVGGGDLDGRYLWSLLKQMLSSSEQQRFMLLNNINSDQGRSRAWIRASLNEQCLERFFNELLRDKTRLKQVYEEWAFVRDIDRSVLLPSMVAGLASVRFAIQIDDSNLNGETEKVPQALTNSISSIIPLFKQEATSQPVMGSIEPELAQGSSQSKHVVIKNKVKKKKLKLTSQVVSFEDKSTRSPEMAQEAYTSPDPASTCPISPFSNQSTEGDDSFLFNQTDAKDKAMSRGVETELNNKHALRKEESYSSIFSNKSETSQEVARNTNNSNTSLELSFDSVSLDDRKKEEEQQHDAFDIYNSTKSTLKTESTPKKKDEFTSTPLTPVTNKDVGVLFPVHPEEKTSRNSLDLDNVDSSALDYAAVPAAVSNVSAASLSSSGSLSAVLPLASSTGHKLSVNNYDTVSNVSGDSNRSTSSLGKEDLRKALLSIMEKKEELEDQIKSLRLALDEEALGHRNLKSDYDILKNENQEQKDKLESRNSILSRENELLKHQLKKYVGAVQKLRDGPQAYETLAHLESQNESKEINSKYVDYHYEASEYEKKLIQVAEMHGELLEFNEMLQKTVQTKDQLIQRLRTELVCLRGPLPDDQESWENSSISGSDVSSFTGNARILVNIWIPSVFLTGTGSSKHHLYQVYIRIQDTEWNVYRRYNQFLDLHQQNKKQDPIMSTFQFPPKKAVGNKSERFVENRRKQLQSYLRSIVNYLVSTNEVMANCPDKETLISLMPFFCDAPSGQAGQPSLGLPAHSNTRIVL